MPVSLSPESVEAYEAIAAAWVDEVAGRCRRAGAAYVQVNAHDDPEEVLLRSWLAAGVLR